MTQGSGAPCNVSFSFSPDFSGQDWQRLQIDPLPDSTIQLKGQGNFILSAILIRTIIYFKTRRVLLKKFRAELGDAWELLGEASRLLHDELGAHSSLVAVQVLLETFAWSTLGRLGTTRRSLQDHSNLLHSPTKYSGACRTDIHGPTMEASRTRTGDYIPPLL